MRDQSLSFPPDKAAIFIEAAFTFAGNCKPVRVGIKI